MANLPADLIAAIDTREHRPTPFTDAEIGWMMKCKAQELIDAGEIKTEQDALERFKLRAQWIADMTEIGEDTRAYWIKFEQAFFRSARKYLAEKREIESVFK